MWVIQGIFPVFYTVPYKVQYYLLVEFDIQLMLVYWCRAGDVIYTPVPSHKVSETQIKVSDF